MKQICGLVTKYPGICVATVLATGVVLALRYLGFLQGLEWAAYDALLRVQTPRNLPLDERIKIVTIDEADLHAGGQALISDRALAEALKKIAAQNPRVIGIDLYRDLPTPPGTAELETVFREIPNIVGVQKIGQPPIAPPPILAADDRAKASDFLLDGDNRVRRGFLFLYNAKGERISSFATYLALWSLEEEKNIQFEVLSPEKWQLGAATFEQLGGCAGGYVRTNTDGFQFLINYRGTADHFDTVPFREVLAGNLPADWGRDRIVLIGATAESLNDFFATPMSGIGAFHPPKLMAGIEIHAQMIAQILDAAEGKRPLIKTIPEPLEILWIFLWSFFGACFIGPYARNHTHPTACNLRQQMKLLSGEIVIISVWLTILTGLGYGVFTSGIWLPIAPSALGFLFAGGGILIHTANQVNTLRIKNQLLEHLANFDSLTHVANRRSFDDYLKIHWEQAKQQQYAIAVILCDLDYFKQYNDAYGHPQGDRCLREFAKILSRSVPMTVGLVARYGGEEFAIVLPHCSRSEVRAIAARIHQDLHQAAIPHRASFVSHILTASLGIAHTIPPREATDPNGLVNRADKALYQAKQQGRDRAVFS